jgi:uncharacterized protein (TIRG00374 family)
VTGRATLVALGLATSIAAIGLLVVSVDLGRTIGVLGRASPLPLIAVLAVMALQLVVRTLRWRLLLPRVDRPQRVRLSRLLPVLLVGYLGNSVLPARLGEPVRAFLVSRREGVPFAGALGSVVLERVFDVSTLAAIGFAAALATGAAGWIVQGTAIAAVVGVVGLTLLVAGALHRVAGAVPSRRLGELVRAFADSAGRQPRADLSAAIALSCLAWLFDATIFYLVADSLSLHLAFPTAMLIGAVTVIGTAIPSAPGYIGTFELAAVAAGTALGLASENALALAILVHAMTSLPMAIAGIAALGAMSFNLGRLSHDAEEVAGV